MAGPFDALFSIPVPESVRPASRIPALVGDVCQKCQQAGVFWSMPPSPFTLCEMREGRVIRHQCIARVDDFDILP